MRRIAPALLAALVLAGCGGGGSDSGDDAASAPETSDATLTVRDEAARHRPKAETAFTLAVDGQDLLVGDTVRTNGTGFVEIDYADGSFVRLDADAEFTLTALTSSAEVQRVEGSLDIGRAWSNVQELSSSDDGYEITTPVATAAVRGTIFNTDCTATDGSCTFTVVDGVVVVTPNGGDPVELRAGDSLTVRADGTTTAHPPVTLARLRLDPWIAKNLDIDEDETGETPTGLPEQAPDEEASALLEGTWTVTRTVTASNNPLQPAGEVSEVTYRFTRACEATACTVRLDAGGTRGASQEADLVFVDGRFEGPVTGRSPCRNDAGTELSVSPISGNVTISPSPDDPGAFTGTLAVTIGASPGCGERTTSFSLTGRQSVASSPGLG